MPAHGLCHDPGEQELHPAPAQTPAAVPAPVNHPQNPKTDKAVEQQRVIMPPPPHGLAIVRENHEQGNADAGTAHKAPPGADEQSHEAVLSLLSLALGGSNIQGEAAEAVHAGAPQTWGININLNININIRIRACSTIIFSSWCLGMSFTSSLSAIFQCSNTFRLKLRGAARCISTTPAFGNKSYEKLCQLVHEHLATASPGAAIACCPPPAEMPASNATMGPPGVNTMMSPTPGLGVNLATMDSPAATPARSAPGVSSPEYFPSIDAVINVPRMAQAQSHQAHYFQAPTSPDQTPTHRPGVVLVHASGYPGPAPAQTTIGSLTAPRANPPRPAGMAVTDEPPPLFELSAGPRPAQALVSTARAGDLNAHGHSLLSGMAEGADALALQLSTAGRAGPAPSEGLMRLIGNVAGQPTVGEAVSPANFPFMEGVKQAKPINWGVIKLKNIPFSSKRCEIIAFLGRNSKILNDVDEGVHIIMERVTSKTMDAYVEFISLDDATRAVERHRNNAAGGRPSRLGDRVVEVEVSSQGHLMRDLFPIAKGIFWNGATPEFKPFNPNEPWENFKGFITVEEMVMLVKHVEVPHRSPYSRECPQRPYECLISTLKKFPWYMADHITIEQRQAMYKATCELIQLLGRSISHGKDTINLNPSLLKRLVSAGMTCAGFTPCMKDNIAYMARLTAGERKSFHQPPSAQRWRHQYALTSKPGVPADVIEWYVALIREQTQKDIGRLPLRERGEMQSKGEETDMYWGFFWAELAYPMGPRFDKMTLAAAAHAEFAAVERIITRALMSN
ncbi:hypothetical protein ESCO_001585 [Escovopsis weberi]|uniref:RRM domain-containing protein n=1 Tax=Escovopsis weberi TaxID=150374 RepID=A0A0M8N6S9_ESCWE|nr:hypothetical protein ESCO_001585 [Escovopsis weberi]